MREVSLDEELLTTAVLHFLPPTQQLRALNSQPLPAKTACRIESRPQPSIRYRTRTGPFNDIAALKHRPLARSLQKALQILVQFLSSCTVLHMYASSIHIRTTHESSV